MPEQAQVTSVEAIAAFRAQLVVYLAQMRPVLDEVTSEVARTRSWIEDDRRRFWLQEFRTRSRKLEDARQELFNASISLLGQGTSLQQLAMHKAQRELRVVEDKLVLIKKWDRELENRTSPLLKQMEQLHGFLGVEMQKAVAYIDDAIRALDTYLSVAPQRAEKPAEPT